jgi:hypothetical protein
MFDEFFDASTQFCVLWDIELHPDMYISFLWKPLCAFRFVSRKLVFRKSLSKLLSICLLLEKLINKKHFSVNKKYFPVKEKFGLIFRKVFSFYFERKTLSGSCEKFKNIILFANYI